MHVGAVHEGERAIIIDDLIATGGTMCAAVNLLGNFLIIDFPLLTVFILISLWYFMQSVWGSMSWSVLVLLNYRS